ncbi:MAG: FAD-binding oxidoreductase [Gemmatimonadetes bacterium]|nr:FAD-binding oxidoreductase [Gemmatimonadota bacterium]
MTAPASPAPTEMPPGFRGVFRHDALARAVYSEAAGVARVIPRAVAVPADTDDLVTLVRWAAAQAVPLIPRGSGSSMGGGAIGDGVIVDLGRLGGIGAVDVEARTVRVGAAVTRDALDTTARTHGLTFPVDPSSGAFATIGGMCATHAAGSRTIRHGPLRDWIVRLECVFADGTRAALRRGAPAPDVPALARLTRDVTPAVHGAAPETLRRPGVRKDSSGYALGAFAASDDPIDLLLGSDGTLAFITAVEVRLTRVPGATALALLGFPSLEAAASAAVAMADGGASAAELLDRSFLDIAASEGTDLGLPARLEAVLLIEAEGTDAADAIAQMDALVAIGEAHGATHRERAETPAATARLWALRHAASPILNRLAPRWQSLQLVEDGCVPPARFADYVRGVRAALDAAGLRGVIFGHAGDAHAHVNALVDLEDPTWRTRCEHLLEAVTTLVATLGGTLAGEHGDGRLRTPLLARVWPAASLTLFAAVKRAFDPDGLLNPGVKVPLPGAVPLDALKVDPGLPPLPAAARAALDRVTRERRWDLHRLDLLPTES